MPLRNPQAALNARLSDALGAHDVSWDDKIAIQNAYMDAGMDQATWNDLPADIRAKIVEIEQTPRTSWDDPADVPDELQ